MRIWLRNGSVYITKGYSAILTHGMNVISFLNEDGRIIELALSEIKQIEPR